MSQRKFRMVFFILWAFLLGPGFACSHKKAEDFGPAEQRPVGDFGPASQRAADDFSPISNVPIYDGRGDFYPIAKGDSPGDREGMRDLLSGEKQELEQPAIDKRSLDFSPVSQMPIPEETRDLSRARYLTNLGVEAWRNGEYASAQKYQTEALTINREVNDREGEAKILTNLGLVARALGDYATAREYQKEALKLHQQLQKKKDVAKNLNNLGVVERMVGDYGQALEYFEQALALDRELRDRSSEGKDLINLGVVYTNLTQYASARENFERGLAIHRAQGDRVSEGKALLGIAIVYLRLGKSSESREYFKLALAAVDEVDDIETCWRVMKGLQEVYVLQKTVPAAIYFGKQAVNTLQSMRGRLTRLEQSLQQLFAESKRFVYEQLADLLIDEGRLWEAQQVLAMLKEEEYFDFIRRQGEDTGLLTQLALTPHEREYVARYQALKPLIVTLGRRYGELLQHQQQRDLTFNEQTEFQQIEADLNHVRQAFEVFLRDLEVAFKEAPREQEREFPEAELKNLEALQSTLATLGPGTVALHYFSTKDRLRVIVTSGVISQVPFHRDSPIEEVNLNRQILAFRKTMENPHMDPLPQAQGLYNLLFGRVAEDLKKLEAKTLLVYLDGALRYLPLSALHDGTHYVAEKYGVVLYTPAAKDKLKDRPLDEWRVAGMGVSQGSGNFSALPAVPEELDGIVKEARDDDLRGVLPGITNLDQAFTKEQFSGNLRRGYPVVHLASHFHFGGGTDVDSYFLVGGGEKLTLSEFKGMAYPLGQVDLLTLSACETGVGGAGQDGREVEGLGALAQRRGAKAVMATLWSVADRSTGQFMQWFYQLRQEEKLTKTEALRRVQEMFIRGESLAQELVADTSLRAPGSGGANGSQTFPVDPAAKYAHPYYWAPFILMGNFH